MMTFPFSIIRFHFCVAGLLVALCLFASCESNTGAGLQDESGEKKRSHDELPTVKELYESSLVLPLQENLGKS